MKRLVFAVVAIASLGGCSSPEAAPTPPAPVQRLTAPEVEQIFLDWACPSKDLTRSRLFKPTSITALPDGDTWKVYTARGSYTLRESTRVVVPPFDESTLTQRIRSTAPCR